MEYLKTAEFYTLCYATSAKIVKIYYKSYYNKSELIDAGYDYILNNVCESDIPDDMNMRVKYLARLACKGITKYFTQNALKKCTPIEESEFFNKISDKTNDLVGYIALNSLLNEFLMRYTPQNQKIYITYIKSREEDPHLNMKDITKRRMAVKKFRNDFYNFLIENGYLVKKINQPVKKHQFNNELIVYKLIRDDGDIEKYAKTINKPPEYVNNAINHIKNCKLNLVEIRKIQQQHFQQYNFIELCSEVDSDPINKNNQR